MNIKVIKGNIMRFKFRVTVIFFITKVLILCYIFSLPPFNVFSVLGVTYD